MSLVTSTILSALPGTTPTAEIDNATNKGIIRTALGITPNLVVSDTAPASPADGQQWLGLTAEVLHIWSNTKSRWISISSDFDADAAAYIAAVTAAGATVTANQRAYINAFYVTGKKEGWYSSIKRLYLPIWGIEAPSAIDMVGLTSGTFVSGITHSAGYVTTDGTTGHFLADVSPGGAGCTLNGTGVFALTTAASSLLLPNTQRFFGSQAASNNTRVFLSGNATANRFGSSGLNNNLFLTFFANGDQRGVQFIGRSTSANTFVVFRNSALLTDSQASTSSTLNTTTPMCWLAGNNNGAISGYAPNTARLGAAGMTEGMSQATAEAFTLQLKALWENCTGISLP
jgi:hypothetical protein